MLPMVLLQGIVHMVGLETGRTQPGNLLSVDKAMSHHPRFPWCQCFWDWNQCKWSMSFVTQNYLGKSNQRKMFGWIHRNPTKIIFPKIILAWLARYGVACGVGYKCRVSGRSNWSFDMEERAWPSVTCLSSLIRQNGDHESRWDDLTTSSGDVNVCQMILKTAVADWKTLVSDDDAVYDKVIRMMYLILPDGDLGDQSFMGVTLETLFQRFETWITNGLKRRTKNEPRLAVPSCHGRRLTG